MQRSFTYVVLQDVTIVQMIRQLETVSLYVISGKNEVVLLIKNQSGQLDLFIA